ncbi:hypothetical protein PoB_001513900 [Plakobranchus ocellatus]|uniref:Uncharacterized protein n=1 Tax=Plakobranchus ocellatus TaxID=259542 RepID=A0AAV3Z003_9GAST|nr:hypothetical protein PoB_001513900 [Plakobranchus ocellatus]
MHSLVVVDLFVNAPTGDNLKASCIVDPDPAVRNTPCLTRWAGAGCPHPRRGSGSVTYSSYVFEKKNRRAENFDRELIPLTRTTGKNPACTTGANRNKTRAGLGKLCTPGTVAVNFKSDWSVQAFFSRTGEARPCATRPDPGPLST